jgi:hypothetical protein
MSGYWAAEILWRGSSGRRRRGANFLGERMSKGTRKRAAASSTPHRSVALIYNLARLAEVLGSAADMAQDVDERRHS